MTQPTPPPGPPAPPGYGQPFGYGQPIPPPIPPRPSRPIWPWLVGGAVVFAFVVALGGTGLVLALHEAGQRAVPAAPQPALPWAPPERAPATPSAEPEPPRVVAPTVTISGRGDKTTKVALEPDAGYVATITHDGDSNFMVEALDHSGQPIGLVVNAIGAYAGDRTVGLMEREAPAAFRVRADGAWKIVLRDLTKAPTFTGKASGREPAVFLVPDAERLGTQITATHTGRANFVVRGYGDDDRIGLFVNEIGRYRGTADLPPDLKVIEVEAQGGWTLQAVR
ncbi:hypothetical protein AB0J74_32060 [Asanoa sp. NPDC049573]|uniref:hypothetical protein n=1 Tax=Asanoa sp. NPDC049573 TaxID=3155396 RepID=UPI00342CCB56